MMREVVWSRELGLGHSSNVESWTCVVLRTPNHYSKHAALISTYAITSSTSRDREEVVLFQ